MERYFNTFVLIVQSFQKIPALKDVAPTQNDPPFKFTQLVVLVAFIALGIGAAIPIPRRTRVTCFGGKKMIKTRELD